MRGPDGGWRVLASQAGKFCLVGLLNSAITFLAFILLYRVIGLPEYPANAVSYVLGLANGFFWNKRWTFKSRGFRLAELFLFIIVFLACYGAQLAAYGALRRAGLQEEIAQAFAMAAYTVLNFAGNKLVTFRKGERDA